MSCSHEETYQPPLFHTASDEKLDEGIGMRPFTQIVLNRFHANAASEPFQYYVRLCIHTEGEFGEDFNLAIWQTMKTFPNSIPADI